MFGSYYEADYYENPVPYTSTDVGAPVPGWGPDPRVAGPPYVGVGAVSQRVVSKYTPMARRVVMGTPATTPTSEPGGTVDQQAADAAANGNGEPMAWWIWPVAAVVIMGGVGYLGVKQGWL